MVGITCVLSMFGAILIALSYLLIKEIRTKAREILVHLSFMDFMVATANFVGVVVNFDQYLSDTNHKQYSERTYNIVNTVCVTQASFAMYGTLASILWTIAIAAYIYLRVMFDKKPVARRAVYAFYVICYGLPLIMTLWYSIKGKLGYTRYGGSGWCSLVLTDAHRVYPLDALLGNDMWLYLTIVLVPVIYVSLYFYLRFEVCYPVLHCVTLCYPVLHCVTLCYIVLPCVTPCYIVTLCYIVLLVLSLLHCFTLLHYVVLPCVSYPVLHCVMLCYIVLPCVTLCCMFMHYILHVLLWCMTVHCIIIIHIPHTPHTHLPHISPSHTPLR